MNKVIALCSGKGGVGKSTTAACVGAAIVCRDKRVLLIDADQGLCGLGVVMGMQTLPLFDICDSAAGNCDFYRTVTPCEMLPGLNLAVVSAGEDFCTAQQLQRYIGLVRSQFDYILIDAPAGVGREFETVCGVCDDAIVLTTPDEVALLAASKAAELLDRRGAECRLLINRYDRTKVKKGLSAGIDECIDTVRARLIGVVPEEEEFHKLGKSGVLRLTASASAAPAYHNIAARICGEEVPLIRL